MLYQIENHYKNSVYLEIDLMEFMKRFDKEILSQKPKDMDDVVYIKNNILKNPIKVFEILDTFKISFRDFIEYLIFTYPETFNYAMIRYLKNNYINSPISAEIIKNLNAL